MQQGSQQVWTSWPGGIGYPTTIPLKGGRKISKKSRKASKKSRKASKKSRKASKKSRKATMRRRR